LDEGLAFHDLVEALIKRFPHSRRRRGLHCTNWAHNLWHALHGESCNT
jgi:hypothetical protein